jgi:hypothetical protein
MASIFLVSIVAVKGIGTNLNRITAQIDEVKKNIMNRMSVRFNRTQTLANRDLAFAGAAFVVEVGFLLRNVFLAIGQVKL